MIRYALSIGWSDEDNVFVVEVPELPGCMADGATDEDANSNVKVVIDKWIATAKTLGRPVPVPKGRFTYA